MDFISTNAYVTVPSITYLPEDMKTIYYKVLVQFGQ